MPLFSHDDGNLGAFNWGLLQVADGCWLQVELGHQVRGASER